ncbi:hypothetical protein [Rhodopila sp.]|uniref:hypothetical protein n=1 Tax=Rhodopila sp. TaxID=2480087 RepID=UPI003D0CF9C6
MDIGGCAACDKAGEKVRLPATTTIAANLDMKTSSCANGQNACPALVAALDSTLSQGVPGRKAHITALPELTQCIILAVAIR